MKTPRGCFFSAIEEDGELLQAFGKATCKIRVRSCFDQITWPATIRFDRLLQSPPLCNCAVHCPETMSFISTYFIHLAHV